MGKFYRCGSVLVTAFEYPDGRYIEVHPKSWAGTMIINSCAFTNFADYPYAHFIESNW